MEQPKIETKEKLPLNLKTNPEETLEAMGRIEGNQFLEDQKEAVKRGDLSYTVPGALRWLNGEGPNDTGGESYIVYGLGGMHRYYVREGGSIRFSERHSLPKYIEQAKKEGFEV